MNIGPLKYAQNVTNPMQPADPMAYAEGWRFFVVPQGGPNRARLSSIAINTVYPTWNRHLAHADAAPTHNNQRGLYFFKRRRRIPPGKVLARVVGFNCIEHTKGFRAEHVVITGLVNQSKLAKRYGVVNLT